MQHLVGVNGILPVLVVAWNAADIGSHNLTGGQLAQGRAKVQAAGNIRGGGKNDRWESRLGCRYVWSGRYEWLTCVDDPECQFEATAV